MKDLTKRILILLTVALICSISNTLLTLWSVGDFSNWLWVWLNIHRGPFTSDAQACQDYFAFISLPLLPWYVSWPNKLTLVLAALGINTWYLSALLGWMMGI